MNTESSVRLRAMEPEDLELLYRIENDQELWGVGISNVPYSRFTLHEYIAQSAGDIYADRQVRLVMENSAGETVGLADLTSFDPRHRRAEVGLVVERPFRRQGYAHAALCQLHGYARHVVGLHQLYAIVDEDNSAALQLFRKMGYHVAATLPQWLCHEGQFHNAQMLQIIL